MIITFTKTVSLRFGRAPSFERPRRIGEDQAAFRTRLTQALREKRDKEIEKLRKRYAPKLARLQKRIQKAEERVEREKGQYNERKYQTAISFGATLLGALLGRRVSGRATTAGSLGGAGGAGKRRCFTSRETSRATPRGTARTRGNLRGRGGGSS